MLLTGLAPVALQCEPSLRTKEMSTMYATTEYLHPPAGAELWL